MMRWASICSGIGAPELAWRDIFGAPQFVAEIDKFPSAVLAHRFPEVPNLGDFTKIEGWHEPIELLVGGTPCQAFSVAGKRAGLDDPRGHLTLEFLALARRLRPRWLVWENVPGVLSDDGGETLAAVLGLVGQLGYRWAYRVHDAQYHGVAQRRRRVFLVGHLGDGAAPWAVLLEPESLRGDPPPRREAGDGIAPTISARTKGGGGLGTDFDCDGGLVAHALRGEGFDASEDGTGRGTPLVAYAPVISPALKSRDHKGPSSDGDGDGAPLIAFSCKDHGADADGIAPKLRSMGHDGSHANAGGQVAVAIQERAVSENAENGPQGKGWQPDCAYTLEARHHVQAGAFDARQSDVIQYGDKTGPLDTDGHTIAVNDGWIVRRLTPRECERLQGFPDDWTLIPWRKGMAPDGPRYKAIGNSMAVPVMRWIGQRIAAASRSPAEGGPVSSPHEEGDQVTQQQRSAP